MWEKHITDSLTVVELLKNYQEQRALPSLKLRRTRRASSKWRKFTEILDLGTGGGFPGIPLAIMFPECHFTLLDARRKKIDCITEFVAELGLNNVTPQWGRAEDGSKKFDLIVTRATSYIDDLLTWIWPLLKDDGRHGSTSRLPEKNGVTAWLPLANSVFASIKPSFMKRQGRRGGL